MMPIVIAGYAVVMLTIVVALFSAAHRPAPKAPVIMLPDVKPIRKGARASLRMAAMTPSVKGGTEVLAFGA